MKIPKLLPQLAFPLLLLASCHKSGGVNAPVSFNFVNAMTPAITVVPVFATGPIQYYASAQSIPGNSAYQYAPSGGVNPLYIVKNTDTTHRIFSGSLSLGAGNIYSFFLSGDPSKPDTLLVQDNIPVYNDSSAGVRFVNLSPDSQPVKVNIKGNTPDQSEFSSLGYKQISAFKKYAAGSSVPGNHYIFELRDQASDSLLLTYTWTYTSYRTNTLALSGSAIKSTNIPLKIFQVNNY